LRPWSPLQTRATCEELRQTRSNHLGTQCKARESGRKRYHFQSLSGEEAAAQRHGAKLKVNVELLSVKFSGNRKQLWAQVARHLRREVDINETYQDDAEPG
jgi:hypothetical protein